MPLDKGTRRGPYEILAPLGAGGMGEVYRARDTRLQRDVAIKSLPADFAADPERLARFQREARLLASLNHPNIAAIYGLEETGGETWLVLEIVEGESLAEKLAAGPLPVEEALAVSAQIAAGVSAAHEAGVIHRDLKPGNVMIRHDGSVKVLDFGLAKGTERSGTVSDLTASPTVSLGTQAGVILGTAAYMSPEQTRGRALDKRTDVWSFGCILYECLTGRQAFGEETVSDTLASIIRSEPDWNALPAQTPAKIRDLVKRCLQKDPRRRLHDMADARIEIEEALAAPAGSSTAPAAPGEPLRRSSLASRLLWVALGFLLGALAAAGLRRFLVSPEAVSRPAPVQSSISLPPDAQLTVVGQRPSIVFSPDGSKLVFRARQAGVTRLYIRSLDRPEAVPIAGTEAGMNPFFSPDGEWLGFFTARELKKVSLSGGPPVTLTVVPPVTEGGTWCPDGSIIFSWTINSGLRRVPSTGGTPETLVTPDASKGEHALTWPQTLPDGKSLLVVVRAGRDFQDIANSNIVVYSLATKQRRLLVSNAAFARYVPPGYLVFIRGTTVLAARCDPKRWELTGPAVPVIENVLTGAYDGAPFAAASGTGLLVYALGGKTTTAPDSVLRVDRAGREEAVPLPAGEYGTVALSPDNKRLAVQTVDVTAGLRTSLAIYEFDRKVLSPLTTGPGRFFCPAWSRDGKRLAFSRFLVGNPQACWKAADGGGDVEPLTPGGFPEFPTSFSPDGRVLFYTRGSGELETTDIWTLSLEGKREARPWLATPSREFAPFPSPDGRWVAYTSIESGRNEIYVRPYPGPGGQTKISSNGGIEPAWSPDGGEIFYRSADSFMAVPVRTSPDFSAGQARALFPDRYAKWGREDGPRTYDVFSDGSGFLVIRSGEVKTIPVTSLNLVSDWTSAVERATGTPKR